MKPTRSALQHWTHLHLPLLGWILAFSISLFPSCARQATLNKLHSLPAQNDTGINGVVIAPAGTLPHTMPDKWSEIAPFWMEAALPLPGNLCLIPSTQEEDSGHPLVMCVLDESKKVGKVVSAKAVAGLVCTFQDQPLRLLIAFPSQSAATPWGKHYIDILMTHPSFFNYLEQWLKAAFPTGAIRDVEWRPGEWCLETIERHRMQ